MPDIVLATLNAKYIHAAFGLRYLHTNLGSLRERAVILEFDINQRPLEIVEAVLAQTPRVVGFGVYIWNVMATTEVVALLKRLRPDLSIVLGGPEVSYEADQQEIVRLADVVIAGEADLKFAEVCSRLLAGERQPSKVVTAELPDLARVTLPYELYTEEDIRHRIIYVEASRGCPFTCEFCLSSLDIPVRQFPLTPLLGALERLLERGVRHFKFVDRTFNLNLVVSRQILEFFLERWRSGLFLHFEMIPDRLPAPLRELIVRFPRGALQFEIGIQTFDAEVALRISRRQDYARLEDNFHFLRDQTGVHLHADLIAGLPGETLPTFGAGFDRLVALRPHEIQVGILKRLRGTPIIRHDAEWGMVYSPHPPYELLESKAIDFPTMQRLRRFARTWDLVGNSGNFVATTPLLWTVPVARLQPPATPAVQSAHATAAANGYALGFAAGEQGHTARASSRSPFVALMGLSDWLCARVGRLHALALHRLAELLFTYLVKESGRDPTEVASALLQDYQRIGQAETPPFLRPWAGTRPRRRSQSSSPHALKRQARHA